MSLREGTRRLSLFVGVIGLAVAGFAAFVSLRVVAQDRARNQAFETLVNSKIVQQERNSWFLINRPPGYDPETSEVHKGDIARIHWGKDLTVASIDKEHGTVLYKTTLPSVWSYVLAACLPLVGFLVPWAAVRSIAWVVIGFREDRKPGKS